MPEYSVIKQIYPGFSGSEFGGSLAISGDGNRMVAGGEWYGGNSGVAVIYDKQLDGTWTQISVITGQSGERLGNSVGISENGEYVVVGSPYYTDGSTFSGEVKLYKYNGTTFTQEGNAIRGPYNNNSHVNNVFVNDSIDVLVVYNLGSTINDRAVKIYLHKLTSGSFDSTVIFSNSIISPSGSRVHANKSFVSASRDLSKLLIGGNNASGSSMYHININLASRTSTYSNLTSILGSLLNGICISGDGSKIVTANTFTGDVKIHTGPNWSDIVTIATVPDITSITYFGNAISMNYDGTVVSVGSFLEVVNGNNNSGVCRVWQYENGSWNLKITAQGGSSERLGSSTSVSNDGHTVLIGVPRYNISGAVLSYAYPPPDTISPTLTLTIPVGETLVVYKDQPVPADKYVSSVSDNNASLTVADVTITNSEITNNVFTTPGVYQAVWSVTDGDNTTTATRTILVLNQAYQVPICFVAGTPILTDQGEIAINKLMKGIHTINGQPIVDITETIDTEDTLVKVEANSFGNGVPTVDTVMTNKHKVYYHGEMVEAGKLVGKAGITHIQYTGEFVYNVVLDTYTNINVNGMICETLHPENVQYRLMSLHKQLLSGKCTDEMGQEFSKLLNVHRDMCLA